MELIKKFMKDIEKNNFYILAAQIRKDGKIADEWTRFAAKPRFETYSIAKTFVGVGVGIAVEEGLITLDEKVINSFPEASFDIVNDNAINITVRDLLTMTSGLSETMLKLTGKFAVQ